MVKELIPDGRYNAISGRELVRLLGLSDTRVLRKMIERERLDGALICSCQDGYYAPVTRGEIERYIRSIESHVISCRKSLKPAYEALRALPGQMEMGDYDG